MCGKDGTYGSQTARVRDIGIPAAIELSGVWT